MWKHAFVLLLLSAAAAAQTQYGNPAKPGSMDHGPTGCPWLTEGTAATELGGDVSVTAKVSDMGEGFCTFSRKDGSADSLEILVSKAALPACPAGGTPLKGIGNEAMRCMHGEPRNSGMEMLSSRVRDFHFTVTLTTRVPKPPALPADPQNDALEQIAEQVAGSLY